MDARCLADLMYASDPCQKGDLSWKVVQALLEKVERRDGLIKPLVYLRCSETFFFLMICRFYNELLQGYYTLVTHLGQVEIGVDHFLVVKGRSKLFFGFSI